MHSTSTSARAKPKSQMQSQFIAMSLTFWLQNSHTLDSFNHFLCEKDKKEQRRNNAHTTHRVTSTLTNLNVQRSGTARHLLCVILLSSGQPEAKNECDQTKNRFHHFSSFTFQRRRTTIFRFGSLSACDLRFKYLPISSTHRHTVFVHRPRTHWPTQTIIMYCSSEQQ